MVKTSRGASMKIRYETPPETMDYIRQKWGPFDLDPCCEPQTAKATPCCAEAMRAELNDIKEAWPRIMADKCAKDEVHCTCVPPLRLMAQKAEAERDAMRVEVEAVKARIREFDKSIDCEMRDPNGTIWEVANDFLARAQNAEAALEIKTAQNRMDGTHIERLTRELSEARRELAAAKEDFADRISVMCRLANNPSKDAVAHLVDLQARIRELEAKAESMTLACSFLSDESNKADARSEAVQAKLSSLEGAVVKFHQEECGCLDYRRDPQCMKLYKMLALPAPPPAPKVKPCCNEIDGHGHAKTCVAYWIEPIKKSEEPTK